MKKYLFGTLLGISALTLVGGTVAFAQGNGFGSDSMMESKAGIFGMTVEELETARETMDFEEIALQQGVDIDEMHAQMEDRAISRWQDRGLSDEEIAERLAVRDELREAGGGPYTGGLGFGQGGHGQMNADGTGGNGTGDCNK